MKRILIPILILHLILLPACSAAPTPAPTAQPTAAATQQSTATDVPTATVIPATETPTPLPAPSLAFPAHTTYAPGSILPNHRTRAQMDDDLRAFYDYWKATYLIQDGQTEDGHLLYRIAFGKDAEGQANTVSEGQGYGMIILPVMQGYDPDAQAIFDGLWRFARQHPSTVDSRLMDWNLLVAEGDDSAFDGDADMALGLLMADAQWGSAGEINYKAEADTLITGIKEGAIGPDSHLPLLGDWVLGDGEIDDDYHQYSPRSSDFMLVNFKAFGKATGDPIWADVTRNSQDVAVSLQQNYSPVTGLLPDFILMKGPDHTPEPAYPDFLEGPDDGHYSYNAGRVPWRFGVDALLNDDPVSRQVAVKISKWAEQETGGDPLTLARRLHTGWPTRGRQRLLHHLLRRPHRRGSHVIPRSAGMAECRSTIRSTPPTKTTTKTRSACSASSSSPATPGHRRPPLTSEVGPNP